MSSSDVLKSVERQFPGAKAKGRRAYPYRNSKIFIVDLLQNGDDQRIVVKLSRNYIPKQMALEFENLSRFYWGCRDQQISSPEPLFADPEKGILAMRYVDGTILSHMLHEIKPASGDFLNRAVDLSAAALARFHQLFCWPEGEPISIDPTALEDDLNQCILENKERIDDCNLQLRVTPFFDFTSWNIMIAESGSKLYLIDFPKLNYVFTPHLDLARFRFGLELVKQFPPAKFLGINRWDEDRLFDRFLAGYCRKMQVTLNEYDLRLIACFRKANIRRSQDLKRKGRCGWQPRLEKAYLQTFCREWLGR
jgi:hypothetical protein